MAVDKNYVSEATLFLQKLTKDKPELKKKQIELRNTWWRRHVDFEEDEKVNNDNLVATRGYKYYE